MTTQASPSDPDHPPKMKKNYTPGPWVVCDADGSIGTVETSSGDPVAQAQIVGALQKQNKERLEIRRANARLISAAPELLEAAEYALPEWWREIMEETAKHDGEIAGEITYGDVRRLVTAIAKATNPPAR